MPRGDDSTGDDRVAASAVDLTVSVIVPTFNRRSRLERLLQAIDRLPESRAGVEVLVAVDGATDGTVEMLRDLRVGYPLRLIEQPNRGPAAARNAAIAAATGDVLLFLDDDVVPMGPVISEHLRQHRREPRAAVIGPMIAPRGLRLAPWLGWEAAMLDKQYRGMNAGKMVPTAWQFYTGNASVRRALAASVGGFDERFRRSEDVEFALRLAARNVVFHFAPRAAVHHEPDRTFAGWMRVPYEYGRHAVLLAQGAAPNYLREMRRESRDRNVLSRLVARWCVGHHLRCRVLTLVFGWLITQAALDRFVRLKLALCSGLFNMLLWQGVADATQLGPRVWRSLDAPARARPTVESPVSLN